MLSQEHLRIGSYSKLGAVGVLAVRVMQVPESQRPMASRSREIPKSEIARNPRPKAQDP